MRLIFIFCVFLLISNCKPKPNSPEIVRNWRMVYELENHLSKISPEKRALLDSLPKRQYQKVLQEVEQQIQQNIFSFYKDQTYELSFKGGEVSEKGTWHIKEGKKLILQQATEKGKYSELTIEKLENDTLIVVSKQENGKPQRTIFVGT